MARGAEAKKQVIDKLLSTFEGSFLYNDCKEVRVPVMENGELIQIKVTLTAAKENVNVGDDNLIPGSDTVVQVVDTPTFSKEETKSVEPTKAEQDNVNDLLRALGL